MSWRSDLTVEEILHPDQSRVIKQAKFTYSTFGKSFRKRHKNNWRPGKKQVQALKGLKSDTQQ